MSTFRYSIFRISTRCLLPTDISSILSSGFNSKLYFSISSLTFSISFFRSIRKPFFCFSSMPSMIFSYTVRLGTSLKCWCTIPIPWAIASMGLFSFTSFSLIRIFPSVGSRRPYSIFISVDFPAPFSPTIHLISCGSTEMFIWSFAVKSPNLFVRSIVCIILIISNHTFPAILLFTLRARIGIRVYGPGIYLIRFTKLFSDTLFKVNIRTGCLVKAVAVLLVCHLDRSVPDLCFQICEICCYLLPFRLRLVRCL